MLKVKLVVANGAHAGKIIPVAGAKFLIGRDPTCQLRPASMSISKMHCAIQIRENSVVVSDFGSTNGTLVNQMPIVGEHVLKDGDHMAIGPLEFTVSVTVGSRSNVTPVPAELKAGSGSNLKAVAGKALTPAPRPSPLAGEKKPTPAPIPKVPAPAPKLPPQPIPKSSPPMEDPDHIAAMLLGMEEEDVPGGSTAIGIPALTDGDIEKMKTESEKKKKSAAGDSSVMAGDILKKLRGGR